MDRTSDVEGIEARVDAGSSRSQSRAGELCPGDPVVWLLVKIRLYSASPAIIFALAVCLYALLGILPGFIISAYSETSVASFLPIYDPREFVSAVTNIVLVPATLWTFYIWQPAGILSLLEELSKKRGICEPREPAGVETFIENEIVIPATGWRHLALVTSLLMAGTLAWALTNAGLSVASLYGKLTIWWAISPAYYYGVWLPGAAIDAYVIVWIIFRQWTIVRALARFFNSPAITIRPAPAWPDGCNGLAPVGNYVLRLALVAVALGWFFAAVIIMPWVAGGSLHVNALAVVALGVYGVALAVFVVGSVWEPHRFMSRYRQQLLSEVARQLQASVQEFSTKKGPRAVRSAVRLSEFHKVIGEQYGTWPFSVAWLQRFLAVAVTPILSTIASFVIQHFR